MKKSIVISIPEPCHEDWAKMTATEKGKFCSVCTKDVFDFTSKTDEELVKILSNNKNACGRLNKSQLNREVKLERKSGQSFAPFAASLMLPLTLFSNNPETENTSISEKPMTSLGIGRFNYNSLNRIQVITTGRVIDFDGNPLKNVEIKSDETHAREWTNKNGEFKIVTLDRERLLFSIENYDTKEIKLGNASTTINIELFSRQNYESSILGKIAAQPQQIKQLDSIIPTKGVVTDDTGLPLPGANVIIKGTSIGTQTDFDGNYSIQTKPGDVLIISFVGFETQEITVSNISNKIDISLNAGSILGEMVAGGISWEPSEENQPPKDTAWREKIKNAYNNTVAFIKLKQDRRKAERKAKRGNK